ncbi:hypothetical protein [Asanoa iriomotensis]|uniref:Type II secretion system protein GspE N-terminal domain-containing protein n=1 Tax=Asanoa iriomotensis TaxID=234613 RepID=A0ABQ4BZ87_9ACTN|nr:hypothetical protein [Asanoa iriomotensis]GIF55847.1 hypothetical protein Air01nite_19420 [Asanoa iriomotensis]
MHEVSESPQEWQGDAVDDPLPTVHRRVMLTDLPESGLADIARRLKLALPEPDPARPETVRTLALDLDPASEFERGRTPAIERGSQPAGERGPEPEGVAEPEYATAPPAGAEPESAAEAAVELELATEPHPRLDETRPALAALPAADIEELASGLLARVVGGPSHGQPAATDELYRHLSLANVQRIDAFVYRVEVGRPVVVVRPSTAPEGTRTLHRVVRAADVWIGVPTATILNPPTDLHEAVYYALD